MVSFDLYTVLLAVLMLTGVAGANGEAAECDADIVEENNYNLAFHVAGVFIVFFASGLGLFCVLIMGERCKNPIVFKGLELTKMFGIGIIISTAWIHLLPDAFANFSNPCLQGGWTEYGTNYVGLFAMIAAFLIHVLEYSAVAYSDNNNKNEECPDCVEGVLDNASATPYVNDKEKNPIDPNEASPKAMHASILIIEAGILVHSVVIGLDLGISNDDNFLTLLIAICFHQLFEGMAIGSLLTSTTLSSRVKYIMGLLYPITTPLGIAIGIGVRHSFNQNSQSILLSQGICDSLSAGLLMYSSYEQLIGGQINHCPVFKNHSRSFKYWCFLFLYLGAATMAVIGIWA
eukprot:Nk52_evm30s252 gene=Nk52_evmTU30s252